MTDRELLEHIAAQVGGLTQKVDSLDNKVDNLDKRVGKLENAFVRMEHSHGLKLDALFDGHKQNSDRLERIEIEVSKQEEIILKRVK